MPGIANGLNITQNGVVTFNNTTGVFTGSNVTQHDVLLGGSANSIVSVSPGTAGQVFTSNGSSADASFQTLVTFQPNKVVSDFDDFISTGDPINSDSTKLFQCNTSASFFPGTSTNTGIYRISTSALVLNNYGGAFSLGASTITLNWVADLVQLSTTLEDFTTQIGMSDDNGSGANNGVYFSYNQANSAGNWELITNTSGTRTVVDSGVPAAIGFNNFGIVVNASGTSASFTINGTLVGTITTNIPMSPLSFFYTMRTNLGFTSVNDIDLFYYTQVFNTPR